MANVDRAELIELLNRLSSDQDATVLEAARTLHRKASESGMSWDELLALDADDFEDPLDEPPRDPVALSEDNADALRLIDRLLRKGVSESLREDLGEFKRNIADGSFDAADRRYLRALAKRLGV